MQHQFSVLKSPMYIFSITGRIPAIPLWHMRDKIISLTDRACRYRRSFSFGVSIHCLMCHPNRLEIYSSLFAGKFNCFSESLQHINCTLFWHVSLKIIFQNAVYVLPLQLKNLLLLSKTDIVLWSSPASLLYAALLS